MIQSVVEAYRYYRKEGYTRKISYIYHSMKTGIEFQLALDRRADSEEELADERSMFVEIEPHG